MQHRTCRPPRSASLASPARPVHAVTLAHPASCLSPLAWLVLVGILAALFSLSLVNTARANTSCPVGLTDTSKGATSSMPPTDSSLAPLDRAFAGKSLAAATFALC